MKLNTNDGNEIKLCILLLTHFKLFVKVAPLTGRVADGLANVVSTIIIPGFCHNHFTRNRAQSN